MLDPDFPEFNDDPAMVKMTQTVADGDAAGVVLGAALALMLLAAFLAGVVIHNRHAARLAAGETVMVPR